MTKSVPLLLKYFIFICHFSSKSALRNVVASFTNYMCTVCLTVTIATIYSAQGKEGDWKRMWLSESTNRIQVIGSSLKISESESVKKMNPRGTKFLCCCHWLWVQMNLNGNLKSDYNHAKLEQIQISDSIKPYNFGLFSKQNIILDYSDDYSRINLNMVQDT